MKNIKDLVKAIITSNAFGTAKPIINASIPLKRAIVPIKPTNLHAIVNKNEVTIAWDKVVGATGYRLYLNDILLSTVSANKFVTRHELYGNLSVIAFNNIHESETSDLLYIKTIPTHPVNFSANFTTSPDGYDFTVNFKDNSYIETSYRLEYTVDNNHTYTRDLPAMDGVGEMATVYFTAPEIYDRIVIRVIAINEIGENDIAEPIVIYMSPEMRWTYRVSERKVLLAWKNRATGIDSYKVRYQELPNGPIQYSAVPNTNQEIGAEVRHLISLLPTAEMKVALCAVVNGQDHAYGPDIIVSKSKDTTLIPPSNFNYEWEKAGTAKLFWNDDYDYEEAFEILVTYENNRTKTIRIESDSVNETGKRYAYSYKFEQPGALTFRVRMCYDLNESEYSEPLPIVYIPVTGLPPSYFRRHVVKGGVIFEWEPQEYVETYTLYVKQEGKQDVVLNTQDNLIKIDIDYTVPIQTQAYVTTSFVGGVTSEPSDKLLWTPTSLTASYDAKVVSVNSDTYKLDSTFLYKIADAYRYITTCVTEGVDTITLLSTNVATLFTMHDFPMGMTSWYKDSQAKYDNTISIVLKNTKSKSPVNTSSYYKTEENQSIRYIIYQPTKEEYRINYSISKVMIVCLGDSITAGHPGFWAESMTGDIEHQYPYWLDRRLKFKYSVINKGYGSDRTYNLLDRIHRDVVSLHPQYCLIQIGTNDIYWGAAAADGSMEAFEKTLTDMKNNMRQLASICLENNIKPIIGLLIPRTQSVTDALVKYGLYAFNDWIIEWVNNTEGLNYVDFFNAGKDKIPPTPLEDPNSPGAMNPIYDGDNIYDEHGNLVQPGAGIHLNKEGYRIMAEAIPLTLFQDYTNGIKMYKDSNCTIEAEYNDEDKQNPFYIINVDGMNLGRKKKVVRYIKNIGITPALFSMYPTESYNLEYDFRVDNSEESGKSAYGIIMPNKVIAIHIDLTPQLEDSKSRLEMALVSREYNINI